MHRMTPSLVLVAGLLALAMPAYCADRPSAPAAPAAPAASATQPAPRLRPEEDGSILLHAKDVNVHGTTVRYEPQPNKNTVGYWTKKDDWVSWEFETAKAGTYHVVIFQGCGKGSGGSEVEFAFTAAPPAGEAGKNGGKEVRPAVVKTTVEDTGGFQNFVSRDIGTVELPAGVYTMSVKPLTKPGLAVMDLRSVTLKPAERDKADKQEKTEKTEKK